MAGELLDMCFLVIDEHAERFGLLCDSFYDGSDFLSAFADYVDVVHISTIVFTGADDLGIIVQPRRVIYPDILRDLIAYVDRLAHHLLAGL